MSRALISGTKSCVRSEARLSPRLGTIFDGCQNPSQPGVKPDLSLMCLPSPALRLRCCHFRDSYRCNFHMDRTGDPFAKSDLKQGGRAQILANSASLGFRCQNPTESTIPTYLVRDMLQDCGLHNTIELAISLQEALGVLYV